MKNLQLPITIRTAVPKEIPMDAEHLEAIASAQNAKLVEGYKILEDIADDEPYSMYAEVNIDNDRLWQAIKILLLDYPPEVSLIIGHIDEEPFYSPYIDKRQILNIIAEFENELRLDPFLEFGLMFYDEVVLKEIFIKKAKYIQVWDFEKDKFLKAMKQLTINEIPDINFIDEFPMVSFSVSQFSDKGITTEEIIGQIVKQFE